MGRLAIGVMGASAENRTSVWFSVRPHRICADASVASAVRQSVVRQSTV